LKEDEIGWIFSTQERDKNFPLNFSQENWREKNTLETQAHMEE
jgi:hypothetical protein